MKRTLAIVAVVVVAVGVVWFMFSSQHKSNANTVARQPAATVAPAIDPATIRKLESQINSGDVSQQALALVPAHRSSFIAQGMPMLPKGVTIKLNPNAKVTGQIATTSAASSDHRVFVLQLAHIGDSWLLLSAEVKK